MKNITSEELEEILRKHLLWLDCDPDGERADLSGADLRNADLSGANLRGADLSGVELRNTDLRGANLRGANLRGADLRGADLSGVELRNTNLRNADLSGADLSGADLYNTNLSGADLSGAYLRGADLSGVELSGADLSDTDLSDAEDINFPIACPEKGSFTAFKAVPGGYIVELEVPADARRCSATTRKCRCDKARVVSITNTYGGHVAIETVYSKFDSSFAYKVGETVQVSNFDPNRWHECAPGIHFFITRQEAVDYYRF